MKYGPYQRSQLKGMIEILIPLSGNYLAVSVIAPFAEQVTQNDKC